MATIMLVMILLSACSQGKTPITSYTNIQDVNVQHFADVSNRFSPVFENDGSIVRTLSPSGETLFSYDPTALVDIDTHLSTKPLLPDELRENLDLINVAIRGVFEQGYFEVYKDAFFKPETQAAIKSLRIGKPIKATSIQDRVGDLFIVPVLYGDKLVAAVEVQENPFTNKLEYVGTMHAKVPLSQIPSINDPTAGAITRPAAETVARRTLVAQTSQSGQHELERVIVATNKSSRFFGAIFWREAPNGSSYLISSYGKLYQSSSGYLSQAADTKIPASIQLELTEVGSP